MDKLQGKVAVITGATQGIGLATAKLFVSEGAYVFITGRRHKELAEAVTSIGSNVRGLLFTVQKALPLLNDGASIILTGAAAGSKGTPNFGVASATKAAIRSFARTWTVELKDRRIRTNVLSPGPVLTASLTAAMPAEAFGR